jgi:hypothetical protein
VFDVRKIGRFALFRETRDIGDKSPFPLISATAFDWGSRHADYSAAVALMENMVAIGAPVRPSFDTRR